MKTKTLLFISLLVSTIAAEAQNTPTGFGSVNLGTSTPIGNYGGSALNFGYANAGYDLSLAYAFTIKHSHFGISTKVDYFGNSFNINQYGADWSAGNIITGQTTGSYSGETVLIGAYATIPIQRFSFDFRLMGGIMGATIPAIGVTFIDDNGNSVTTGFNQSSAIGFAYDAGVGVRVAIYKSLCILVDFDYLSSSLSFSQTIYQNSPSFGSSSSYTNNISFISWTGGIGWQF